MTKGTDESEKSLSLAIAALEKRYGRGAIMNLGNGEPEKMETISTGSLGLDIALGIRSGILG
jgi:recombination protein RecA